MRPVSYTVSSYQYQASLRSRLIAFALAAGLVVLLLLMLMRLGIFVPLAKSQQTMTTVELLPGTQSEATRTPTPTKGKQAAKRAAGARPTRVTKAPPQPQPKPPPKTTVPWNVMPLSHSEMTQSDISAMPSHQSETAANGQAAAGAGQGADGAAASGSGEGPGGAQLYNAEWYRRPTRAETDTYFPHNLQPGAWGEIICKTVARYHVEDCRELGESPGSGMSRGMRQAAWQFLVTPPRVDGKPLIGAWVRIRYYIVPTGAPSDDGAN